MNWLFEITQFILRRLPKSGIYYTPKHIISRVTLPQHEAHVTGNPPWRQEET